MTHAKSVRRTSGIRKSMTKIVSVSASTNMIVTKTVIVIASANMIVTKTAIVKIPIASGPAVATKITKQQLRISVSQIIEKQERAEISARSFI